jgi:hypothetical protein
MKISNLLNDYGTSFGIRIALDAGETYRREPLPHCRTRHVVCDASGAAIYDEIHSDDVWDQVRVASKGFSNEQ